MGKLRQGEANKLLQSEKTPINARKPGSRKELVLSRQYTTNSFANYLGLSYM